MKNNLTKRNVLKQSYALNNSSYKLSSLSLDIIMALISEINNEDNDFFIYKFNLIELEKKFNKQIDERTLGRVADELLSSTITMKNGKDFFKANWVSSFEYSHSTKTFELSFEPKLKPHLLGLKDSFVKSYLSDIVKLRSEYAKRVYLLLRQWEFVGYFNIKIEELQDILVVPKSYLEYKEFKRGVILRSIEQINKNTDLDISFNEIKNGRKVESVKFCINKKNKLKLNKSGVSATENWLENSD